ncbi:MAG: hypothetical protein GXY52_05385 [Chloroflexi bacterium]|mgnify:CR=1 FL=1|nr:hypothetical protein [Chloroflexota bacterium]
MQEPREPRTIRLKIHYWILGIAVLVLGVYLLRPAPASTATIAEYPYPDPQLFLPLAFKQPTPCNTSWQALQNPSFETGMVDWETVAGIPERVCDLAAEGSCSVLMGGYNNANDRIRQQVTVPEWAESAALYVVWAMATTESSFGPVDSFYPQVKLVANGATLGGGPINNLDPTDGWYESKFVIPNIAAYRGQAVYVDMYVWTDGFLPTIWAVDYVRLNFACGAVPASGNEAPVKVGELDPALLEQIAACE